MKPSQIPNRLSQLPPRKTLFYQRPEPWCPDRPTTGCHSSTSVTSAEFVPKGENNKPSSTRPQLILKDTDTQGHPAHLSGIKSSEPYPTDGSENWYRASSSPSPTQTGPGSPSIPRPVSVSPLRAESISSEKERSVPHSSRSDNNLSAFGENSNICLASLPQGTVHRTEYNSTMRQGQHSNQSHPRQAMAQPRNPVLDLNCRSFRKQSESSCKSTRNSSPWLGSPGNTRLTSPTSKTPSSPFPGLQSPSKKSCEKKHSHVTQRKDVSPHTESCEPSQVLKLSGFSNATKQIDNLSRSQRTRESKSAARRTQSNTLPSYTVLQRDHSSHCNGSSSALAPVTPNSASQPLKRRRSDSCILESTSKRKSTSPGSHTPQKPKAQRAPRLSVLPEEENELFTPDPTTYVITPSHKTLKSKITDENQKSPSSEKGCLSLSTPSSRTTVSVSPKYKTASCPTHASCTLPILMPTISIKRVNPDISTASNKNRECTSTSNNRKSKTKKAKVMNSPTLDKDAAASEQTSASLQSPSQPLEHQSGDIDRMHVDDKDPIDLDLNLDFRLALDFDDSQSSHSSEEEQLISFQDMIALATKHPETPKYGTFSEPTTPGNDSPKSKSLLPSIVKRELYQNNLDQMLKEIQTNKRSKEIETQLRTACIEDLSRIAEYEQAEENPEEDVRTEEQRTFLQRFSLVSSAFREVPPGEAAFCIEKFGHIFNQDTLELRQCKVKPQGRAQKALLWSSPAQLRLHVSIGLFQEAYDCSSPCPPQVMLFLFKMMSVHSERLVSEGLLRAMCDITCTAAYQIVDGKNEQFKVWVPSLAEVTLVLMNMGAAFVTLFPLEDLQPVFSEGDLVEDFTVDSESVSKRQQTEFPEHNFSSVVKYLSYSMSLCPHAYTDNELLLLLTMVDRVCLDTRFIQPSVHMEALLYRILNNFKDWDGMLPRICSALASFTDDHRNMCHQVQLLPIYKRGKQLRQHLSVSMISKLLDGTCTYKPTQSNFQLSELRRYVHRMQPSNLLRSVLNTSGSSGKDNQLTLDQQAYFLCNSLLTLTNEATSLQFYSANQKKQLLILSSLLEVHIKCDIRESNKYLYRTKVKDLVARIYTKWQMLLRRTQPLQDKVYDYWQPPDNLMNNKWTREDEEAAVVKTTEETEEKTTMPA